MSCLEISLETSEQCKDTHNSMDVDSSFEESMTTSNHDDDDHDDNHSNPHRCPRLQPVANERSLHLYAELFTNLCKDNTGQLSGRCGQFRGCGQF